MYKHIQSERANTMTILGGKQFDEVFGDIISASLDSFIETLESIIRFERTHVFGFFVLVDIWENFQTYNTPFKDVLRVNFPSPLPNPFNHSVMPIIQSCQSINHSFIHSTHSIHSIHSIMPIIQPFNHSITQSFKSSVTLMSD